MHQNLPVGLTVAMLLTPLAASAQEYTAVNLGTLGGAAPSGSEGRAINDSGRMTGWSFSGRGPVPQAFMTRAATNDMTRVGEADNEPEGTGINSSGQVTGLYISNDFQHRTHAFVTDAATNTLTDLGTLACGISYYCNGDSYGNGINASGQVTGYSSVAASVNTYHAFITNAQTNVMTDLGTLGGPESEGNGINASGQVTGWADTTPGKVAHAFMTNATTLAMTDLGTLGGASSYGYGINDSGQVTGYSYIAGGAYHAFVTDAATNAMTDLGTLGGANSQGLGINASGQVVGWAQTSTNTQDGFLYSNGQMLDLNWLLTPQDAFLYTLTEATAINNRGQIVANGYVNATGQNVAFLLDPTATSHPFSSEVHSLASVATVHIPEMGDH